MIILKKIKLSGDSNRDNCAGVRRSCQKGCIYGDIKNIFFNKREFYTGNGIFYLRNG